LRLRPFPPKGGPGVTQAQPVAPFRRRNLLVPPRTLRIWLCDTAMAVRTMISWRYGTSGTETERYDHSHPLRPEIMNIVAASARTGVPGLAGVHMTCRCDRCASWDFLALALCHHAARTVPRSNTLV